jgi:hypothetical protein
VVVRRRGADRLGGLLAVEHGTENVDGVSLEAEPDVGMDGGGDANVGVAEEFLDHDEFDAPFREQGDAARDAANSAAAHADKSATYAEEAADHAGDSATYAAVAKKNADAAKAAADAATAAVTKAREIFDLARETENADLETRTDAAIERARSMKTTSDAAISTSAATQVQALSLNDTATALAQEAARPDVDIQATAAKGRQLAMQAMKLLGPWHQEAAAQALSGTDQDVLDYLRTRWKEANHNDVRQRVVELSTQSPYASVRTAATEALKGTPEQIETFYSSGQYDAVVPAASRAQVCPTRRWARVSSTWRSAVRRATGSRSRDGGAATAARGSGGQSWTRRRPTGRQARGASGEDGSLGRKPIYQGLHLVVSPTGQLERQVGKRSRPTRTVQQDRVTSSQQLDTT